jgi:hypothetical protein
VLRLLVVIELALNAINLATISSGLYRFLSISDPPSHVKRHTSGWTSSTGVDHVRQIGSAMIAAQLTDVN